MPFVCFSTSSGEEGFEEAEEKDATNGSQTKKRELYPGLCLPDNPEQVRSLMEPGDVKVAEAAMNEVGSCVCVCVCV